MERDCGQKKRKILISDKITIKAIIKLYPCQYIIKL